MACTPVPLRDTVAQSVKERMMSEAFVRPDTAAFLAFLNSQEGPKMHEIPLADARET
jgi:hypothetical protein